jgi:hypothetical protein
MDDSKRKITRKVVVTKSINKYISRDITSVNDLIKHINNMMTPSFNIDISPEEWVMPNRVKFVNWIDKTFKYSKSQNVPSCECEEGKECKLHTKPLDLFPHQKFVKDYIQYDSPYRGLLLYHNLGSGKSATSVAAAELLKNHMDVVVMVPASIRSNYINEIKKYGRKFYNIKQHWDFVHLEIFKNDIKNISNLLNLDIKIIEKTNGIWIPNTSKKSNFNDLDDDFKDQITIQLNNIIENKFHFINYNGLRKSAVLEMVKKGNPFDNKCVVIDEVHNLVSRMVNKRDIGYALNKLLMEATNCKLILLSGTPIINYTFEIAYLINLIIGYKTLYTFTVLLDSSFDIDEIDNILSSIKEIDYYNIDQNNRKISYYLLPNGFSRNDLYVKRTDTSFTVENFIEIFNKNKIKFNKRFSTDKIKVLPEDKDLFDKFFIDEANSTVKNPKLFMRRILGTVSVYDKFSEDLFPKLNTIEVPVMMTPFQFTEYETSRKTEMKKETFNKFKKVGDEGGTSVYRFYSRAKCNFVFPKEIDRPFPSKMSMMKDEVDDIDNTFNKLKSLEPDVDFDKEYKHLLKESLEKLSTSDYLNIKNISKYSPKFKEILEKVTELNGTSMIYSQFRTVEGLGILGFALEKNGFARFKIKLNSDKQWDLDIKDEDMNKPKFIEYTGNNEETQILKDIFNSEFDNTPPLIKKKLNNSTNMRGGIIKILMITQSGAEGISLKNVRQVHIVEPYWNYIRIDQVIGRAVRTCSHLALPPQDRNVTCYIYYCVFTQKQIEDSFTIRNQDKGMTTDQYIYNIAKRKNKVIKDLLNLLKRAAVDCALNKAQNCFTIPSNMPENKLLYDLNLNREILDNQYEKSLSKIGWEAQILKTKKGNFLIRVDTNEVYDFDIYNDSNKLVKLGLIINEDNGRRIIKMSLPEYTPVNILPKKNKIEKESSQSKKESSQSEKESSKKESSQVEKKSSQSEKESSQSEKESSQSEKESSKKEKSQSEKESSQSEKESSQSEISQSNSEEEPSVKLGHIKYDGNNSCYLDSILFSIMHTKNKIIDSILKAKIKYPEFNNIKTILLNLYTHIQNESSSIKCTNIRQLFSKFFKNYRKTHPNIEDINWIDEQQEPADVLMILEYLLDIPFNTKYQESIDKRKNDPVDVLFNDCKITNFELLKGNDIYLKDYVPKYIDKFTNNSNKERNIIKIYTKSDGMFININRGYVDADNGNQKKSFTIVIPEETLKIGRKQLSLISIIIHKGRTVHSGHYVCYFKKEDKWFLFDDMKTNFEYIGDFINIEKNIYKNAVSFVYI